MLTQCMCKHCFICGKHHGESNVYCTSCMTGRYEEVRRDAELRGLSGDHKDHRWWPHGHDAPDGLCLAMGGAPFYGLCALDKGHDGDHLCT
jgi:hypothetical protein